MRTRLLLKMFLVFAVPAAFVSGPAGALIGRIYTGHVSSANAFYGFALGVAGAIFLGAVMALVLGLVHFSQTNDPRVRHRRTLVVNMSHEEARALCIEAVLSIPNCSVDEGSSNRSRVTLKKGFTWRSWGDIITCDIESTRPNQQTVVIESRPRLRTTMVDYGSNLINVETIVSHLQSGAVAPVTGVEPLI
jgi:hypothetical protein